MTHPFNLKLTELQMLDLDFEQSLNAEEAADVTGSVSFITRSRGETGGHDGLKPCPRPKPGLPKPIDPPIYTTLAIGEEGGWHPPDVTTLALGEEGGHLDSL